MKVGGFKVSEAQIKAAELRMQAGMFSQGMIARALETAGVPSEGFIHSKAADRMIELRRKDGRIKRQGSGEWLWVAPHLQDAGEPA
jgi:hypothetical protein